MEEGLSRPSSVRPSPPQPAPNIFTESHPELANLVPPFVLFPQRARARVAHACNLMRGRYLFSRGRERRARGRAASVQRGAYPWQTYSLSYLISMHSGHNKPSLSSAILPRRYRERKKEIQLTFFPLSSLRRMMQHPEANNGLASPQHNMAAAVAAADPDSDAEDDPGQLLNLWLGELNTLKKVS